MDLASARESLCRGLGSRWFTERFHRNALVTHFQHGQVFCAARSLENYAIARCRLHQRAPQRRHPTDVVAVEIDLVGAHDAHHSLRSRGIGIARTVAPKNALVSGCPALRASGSITSAASIRFV